MKFSNIRVFNLEGAIRGMRNPKESYRNSDSEYGYAPDIVCAKAIVYEAIKEHGLTLDLENVLKFVNNIIINTYEGGAEYASIGPNDMRLAQSLIRAGSEHRKFLRQIFVSVDITAPLYW